MDSLFIIGGVVLAVVLMRSATHGTSGMNDKPIFIDNIRRGVKNGWYTAKLTYVNGRPAVHLSGKDVSGGLYEGDFPISQKDWQTLKEEGYQVE